MASISPKSDPQKAHLDSISLEWNAHELTFDHLFGPSPLDNHEGADMGPSRQDLSDGQSYMAATNASVQWQGWEQGDTPTAIPYYAERFGTSHRRSISEPPANWTAHQEPTYEIGLETAALDSQITFHRDGLHLGSKSRHKMAKNKRSRLQASPYHGKPAARRKGKREVIQAISDPLLLQPDQGETYNQSTHAYHDDDIGPSVHHYHESNTRSPKHSSKLPHVLWQASINEVGDREVSVEQHINTEKLRAHYVSKAEMRSMMKEVVMEALKDSGLVQS